MPLTDDEKKSLKIQKLIAETNTRESSTLVLSTVASSVSLAIFAALFDKSFALRMTWGPFGFWFAFLGFIYRELTIHFSEIRSYRELRKFGLETADVSFRIYIRMVVVRTFLLLPLASFFQLIEPSFVGISVVGVLILSMVFSMFELVRRVDC